MRVSPGPRCARSEGSGGSIQDEVKGREGGGGCESLICNKFLRKYISLINLDKTV